MIKTVKNSSIKNNSWSRSMSLNNRNLPRINSLGSENNPANSVIELIDANTGLTSGSYFLRSPGGIIYQAFIDMTEGGGWIRLNAGAIGPYANPITSSAPHPSGGNMLTGGSTTPLTQLNASYVNQSQGESFGCGGEPYKSIIDINSDFKTDLDITEVRWNVSVITSSANVVCGFVGAEVPNLVVISGTTNQVAVCNNTPNRYGDVNPTSFTTEARGTINTGSLRLWSVYTACGNALQARMNSIWVR
jgi:hypothetical protein